MTAPDPGPPRFLADGMLVKLGKYLRILGYDAQWDCGAPTRELARRACSQGSVLLTRSTRAGFEFEAPLLWLKLASDDPVEQLRQVVEACGLDVHARLFSRCIRCNLELETVDDPALVRARVPEGVRARHSVYFRCGGCGTVFWQGTHVRNTCRKLGIPSP